ncbi:hypothetical protein D3C81_2133850 [compost metagenome]
MQIAQALFNVLVAGIELGAIRLHVGLGRGVQLAVQFQLATVQADTLQAGVDRTNVRFFQGLEFSRQFADSLDPRL